MALAGGRESHCVTISIQKLKMTGGVQNEKEKMTEKPQIMRPNSTARCMCKTPTDFSVLDEGR